MGGKIFGSQFQRDCSPPHEVAESVTKVCGRDFSQGDWIGNSSGSRDRQNLRKLILSDPLLPARLHLLKASQPSKLGIKHSKHKPVGDFTD